MLRVLPAGLALDDVAMAEAAGAYAGAGRLPWPVCRLRARRVGGDVALSWLRRARDDAGRWGELEVAREEAELYRAEVLDGSEMVRIFAVSSPGATYDAAMQAADWAAPVSSPLRLRVVQVSPRYGAGAAAVADLRF